MVNPTDGTERRDRRRGPDILVRSLPVFGVVTAFVITATMVILSVATPSAYTRMSPNAHIEDNLWGDGLLQILFYILIVGATLGCLGLGFNFKRLRRKGDRLRINLVFLILMCLMGIVTYLTLFA